MSLALATSVQGQQPKKDGKDVKDAKEVGGKPNPGRVDWHEKKYAFEMRDKPWTDVFGWLSDQSNMPFSASNRPTGTFTFFNPKDDKGNSRKYSLLEVFDIINEFMQAEKKFTIIRRESTMVIVAADEPIPPILVPRIEISELESRGKTEYVEIVIPLTKAGLNADEFAPQLRKVLGEFSRVVALDGLNMLIVQANVRSLLLSKFLYDGQITPNEESTYTHICKYIKASTAKTQLAESLGAASSITIVSKGPMGGGGGGGAPDGQPMGGGGGGGGGRPTAVSTKSPPAHHHGGSGVQLGHDSWSGRQGRASQGRARQDRCRPGAVPGGPDGFPLPRCQSRQCGCHGQAPGNRLEG